MKMITLFDASVARISLHWRVKLFIGTLIAIGVIQVTKILVG